jgi:hypothetical protein
MKNIRQEQVEDKIHDLCPKEVDGDGTVKHSMLYCTCYVSLFVMMVAILITLIVVSIKGLP